eukprot:4741774-Prymnesium_polylepis.1
MHISKNGCAVAAAQKRLCRRCGADAHDPDVSGNANGPVLNYLAPARRRLHVRSRSCATEN